MTKVTIDKALIEQAIADLEHISAAAGQVEFIDKTCQKLRAALTEPAVEPATKAMTAHRATYFMERFKKEEKLLGPNEQAAVDFVIDMLTAPHISPPPPAEVPMLTEYERLEFVKQAILTGTLMDLIVRVEAKVRQKVGL